MRFGFRRRRPKPGVGVDDWRSPPCERVADVGAEAVVVGRVANGRGQWAAQGEVVIDEKAPPWGHDHADCFGERLGFTERTLEITEEVDERDVDRFGHELRLAAREEAAERAAGTAGVRDDLAESSAVDATLADERRGTLHHARASWRSRATGGRVLRFVLDSHSRRVGHFEDDCHRFC